jgi:hypothetical protein
MKETNTRIPFLERESKNCKLIIKFESLLHEYKGLFNKNNNNFLI